MIKGSWTHKKIIYALKILIAFLLNQSIIDEIYNYEITIKIFDCQSKYSICDWSARKECKGLCFLLFYWLLILRYIL